MSADQLAVPTEQRRRRDQEDRPAIAGEQLRQRREDHPVGRDVAGTGHLPTQDQQLMAKGRDLHVLGVGRWTQVDQPEDLSNDHESQRAHHHHHGLILPARRCAWSRHER
jgi:hypothetical protein